MNNENQTDGSSREMMVIEISFGKGRNESLIVHFGDEPIDLAKGVVTKHNLKDIHIPLIAKHIEDTIKDFVINNPEQKLLSQPPSPSNHLQLSHSEQTFLPDSESIENLSKLQISEIQPKWDWEDSETKLSPSQPSLVPVSDPIEGFRERKLSMSGNGRDKEGPPQYQDQSFHPPSSSDSLISSVDPSSEREETLSESDMPPPSHSFPLSNSDRAKDAWAAAARAQKQAKGRPSTQPPRTQKPIRPLPSTLQPKSSSLVVSSTSSGFKLGLRTSGLSGPPSSLSAHERLFQSAAIHKSKLEQKKLRDATLLEKELAQMQFKLSQQSKGLCAKHQSSLDVGERLYNDAVQSRQKKDQVRLTKKEEWSCSKCGHFHQVLPTLVKADESAPVQTPRICKNCSFDQGRQLPFRPINIALEFSEDPGQLSDLLASRFSSHSSTTSASEDSLEPSLTLGGGLEKPRDVFEYLHRDTKHHVGKLEELKQQWQLSDSSITFKPQIPLSSERIVGRLRSQASLASSRHLDLGDPMVLGSEPQSDSELTEGDLPTHDQDPDEIHTPRRESSPQPLHTHDLSSPSFVHPSEAHLLSQSVTRSTGSYLNLPLSQRLFMVKGSVINPISPEKRQRHQPDGPITIRRPQEEVDRLVQKLSTENQRKQMQLEAIQKKFTPSFHPKIPVYQPKHGGRSVNNKTYLASSSFQGCNREADESPVGLTSEGSVLVDLQGHGFILDKSASQPSKGVRTASPRQPTRNVFQSLLEKGQQIQRRKQEQIDQALKKERENLNQSRALPSSREILRASNQRSIESMFKLLLASVELTRYEREHGLLPDPFQRIQFVSDLSNQLPDWAERSVDLEAVEPELLIEEIRSIVLQVKEERAKEQLISISSPPKTDPAQSDEEAPGISSSDEEEDEDCPKYDIHVDLQNYQQSPIGYPSSPFFKTKDDKKSKTLSPIPPQPAFQINLLSSFADSLTDDPPPPPPSSPPPPLTSSTPSPTMSGGLGVGEAAFDEEEGPGKAKTSQSPPPLLLPAASSSPTSNFTLRFPQFKSIVLRCIRRSKPIPLGRSYVYAPRKKQSLSLQMISEEKMNETFRPALDPRSRKLGKKNQLRRLETLSQSLTLSQSSTASFAEPLADTFEDRASFAHLSSSHASSHGTGLCSAGSLSLDQLLFHEADLMKKKAELAKEKIETDVKKACPFRPTLCRPPSHVVPRYRGLRDEKLSYIQPSSSKKLSSSESTSTDLPTPLEPTQQQALEENLATEEDVDREADESGSQTFDLSESAAPDHDDPPGTEMEDTQSLDRRADDPELDFDEEDIELTQLTPLRLQLSSVCVRVSLQPSSLPSPNSFPPRLALALTIAGQTLCTDIVQTQPDSPPSSPSTLYWQGQFPETFEWAFSLGYFQSELELSLEVVLLTAQPEEEAWVKEVVGECSSFLSQSITTINSPYHLLLPLGEEGCAGDIVREELQGDWVQFQAVLRLADEELERSLSSRDPLPPQARELNSGRIQRSNSTDSTKSEDTLISPQKTHN